MLQSRIVPPAFAALALLAASPAAAVETLSHEQTTLEEELLGSFANAGAFRIDTVEMTVKNLTTRTWTDYHFRIVIPDGGGGAGDFVEVVKLTAPAGPFVQGELAKSPGSTRFDRVNYSGGELPIGKSFTATFEVNHRSSVNVYGRPTYAPEPGTWALMILGFGLAGGALRRRAAPA